MVLSTVLIALVSNSPTFARFSSSALETLDQSLSGLYVSAWSAGSVSSAGITCSACNGTREASGQSSSESEASDEEI